MQFYIAQRFSFLTPEIYKNYIEANLNYWAISRIPLRRKLTSQISRKSSGKHPKEVAITLNGGGRYGCLLGNLRTDLLHLCNTDNRNTQE